MSWYSFLHHANQKARKYGAAGWLTVDDVPPAGDCLYCGGRASTWDHVVPLARGGPNATTNLVPSCLTCNQRKTDHDAPPPVPHVVIVLCGWCWTPIAKRGSHLLAAERRGRTYFACSKQHAGFLSWGLLGPHWTNRVISWRRNNRAGKALDAIAAAA